MKNVIATIECKTLSSRLWMHQLKNIPLHNISLQRRSFIRGFITRFHRKNISFSPFAVGTRNCNMKIWKHSTPVLSLLFLLIFFIAELFTPSYYGFDVFIANNSIPQYILFWFFSHEVEISYSKSLSDPVHLYYYLLH